MDQGLTTQGPLDVDLEFVGTATTLLRLGPFTLLTDPNFLHAGQRAYLGKGLFSKRLSQPAMDPHDLPELDLVLLSHLHGDHFDRVARRHLTRTQPVLTTGPASRRLRRWGFETRGMRSWEQETFERDGSTLTITSTPGVHAAGPARALLPPVMGAVITLRAPGRPTFRAYISGDTLYRPWLRQIVDRCGPLDAAVVHLGGTRVLGVMVTMDGDQGADLVQALAPRVTVPVHFDDYGVFRSPLSDFVRSWEERRLPGSLRTVTRGQRVSLLGDGPSAPRR